MSQGTLLNRITYQYKMQFPMIVRKSGESPMSLRQFDMNVIMPISVSKCTNCVLAHFE